MQDMESQANNFVVPSLPASIPPAVHAAQRSNSDTASGSGSLSSKSSQSNIHHSQSPTITDISKEAKDLKSESTSVSHENYWSGYLEEELPEKTQGKWMRNIRHQIFSLYRRLFGIVFATNMGVFIWVAVTGANAAELALIVVANLFAAVLMRQDHVINAFFNVFCSVPKSWPLWIRRIAARVYSIGGIHSGAATSGVIWLVLFTAQATREFIRKEKISIPTLVISYCILTLLVGIVIFAYPAFRSRHHDGFECVHRFLGWTAVALVWAHVVLLTNDYKEPDQKLGIALVNSVAFWLVAILTGSIILPWTRLRKVPVRSEVLSDHAVRLYFDYATPYPGSFVRVSEAPLTEWHSFATIREPGKKGFSMVVSKAGDWTTKQITQPPSEIWVRGVPTFGVLRLVPMFRRLIFVATGSGIGPFAPHVLAKKAEYRLLWTSPDVRKTFGDKLVDTILNAAPDTVIYDTRKHGKPDMVKLAYKMYKDFDAEAVVIISNPKLTYKVVYGLMSRGVPAFGAIWDS